MTYAGFYINLDRATDRRTEMESELARYGLSGQYKRFSASDGNSLNFPNPTRAAGEVGCFTSHYLLLKQNLDSDKHLHVIEDDTIFAPSTAQAIQWALSTGQLDTFDLLYTDIAVPMMNSGFKAYKEIYDKAVTRDAAGQVNGIGCRVFDLGGALYASTSSYFISRKAIRKIHDALGAALAAGINRPVDLFLRDMCHSGEIKAGCLFPFVTSVRLDRIMDTGVERPNELSALASHLARYAFFVGCDWDLCRKYLDKYLPSPANTDPLTETLSRLLAFTMTDKFHFL